jgi:hypothetical protein
MDVRRLRAGEVIAGLSGLALIVALLLPWYTHEARSSFSVKLPSQNAFEAFAVADMVLLAIAVAAVGLLIDTAIERTVAVPIAYASLLLLAAVVGLLVLLAHLGSSPEAPGPTPADTPVETSTAIGLPLAFLAMASLFAGALLAMRDERLSKGARSTDPTGRPVDRAPEIEQLPAPR